MIYSMYCTWLNMVKLHCSTLIWAVLAGLSAVFLAVVAGVEVPVSEYLCRVFLILNTDQVFVVPVLWVVPPIPSPPPPCFPACQTMAAFVGTYHSYSPSLVTLFLNQSSNKRKHRLRHCSSSSSSSTHTPGAKMRDAPHPPPAPSSALLPLLWLQPSLLSLRHC